MAGSRIVALAVVTLLAGTAEAKPERAKPERAKITKPDQAIKALAAGGAGEVEEATALLRGVAGLLNKHAKDLAGLAAENAGVATSAPRLLALAAERGEEGCAFVASMVDRKHPTWTRLVVDSYRERPACPALAAAVIDVLKWVDDPAKSPDAATMASKVLAIVREAKAAAVGDRACRFVLAGPEGLRREAIDTVLAARPAGAETCLVRAYTEARGGKPCPTALRHVLLDAIGQTGDVDAVPTFVYALESFEDNALACRLLIDRGKAGIQGMLFAIKSSDAKAAGVGECLGRAGDEGVATVLPLLDHPSRWVRDFAVDFLTRQRSAEALKSLRERWDAGKGAIPRAAVLTMLAGFPTADVKDVVEAALFDTSADVRGQALDAIERAHAMDYGPKLLAVAEEDAEPTLRVRTLEVMWRLGDDTIVPLALRMAQYEKPEVVPMAVRVLGFMGGEESVEVVQRLLKAKEEPVVEAAKRALWLLTYRDPAGDDRLSYRGPPEPRAAEEGGVVEVPGGRVTLLGKKGPLVVVLPGGPGMDLTWGRPWLDDVADDAVLAYLEPTGEEPGNGLVSAELLQAAMQAVGRDRAVLVSDWLGGTGALWLAMRVQAVKGVVALAAPLPGRLQAFDEALVAAIPEPFASLAKEVEDADARFAPAALERYMTRLMAPALAGPKVAAEKVLGVRVELGATARAYAALIRPEVAFVAGETGAKVLWLGPLSTLPEELRQAWMGTAAAAPDRLAVEDLPECGFLPSVTCRRDVVKRIERFLEDPGVAR